MNHRNLLSLIVFSVRLSIVDEFISPASSGINKFKKK